MSENAQPLIVIGVGGHSDVVRQLVKDIFSAGGEHFVIEKAIDNRLDEDMSFLDSLSGGKSADFCFTVALGDNNLREELMDRFGRLGKWPVLIHPQAYAADNSSVNVGSMLCVKSVVNPAAEIGRGCIINTAAVIEHHVKIGDFSHIAPNAVLAGNVITGRKVFVGAGAVVINNVKIGSNVTIGAGAVVTKDVEDNQTVVGVPARPV